MKSLLPFLVILLGAIRVSAGDMFRAVEVHAETWEVTFQEKGTRFLLKLDDVDRGVSGYLQTLRMKRSERLTLTEKHSRIEVRPVDENGRKGIEIKTTSQDRFTGQETVTIAFEADHQAATAPPNAAPDSKVQSKDEPQSKPASATR
ncbi:MAG: hypothetical protein CFE26_17470 [Verrucomicrobiales bacterium VVV1]|nr:MAG: hypothetical protein CFE26_17470 [Verrucomicrobiales bacterium VVV1]